MSSDGDLAGEVEPWLRQCGSCDAALPMGCTCPPGDYRNILLKVWRAYEASREAMAEEIAVALESREDDARQVEKAEGIAGNKGAAQTWHDIATSYMRSAELARDIATKGDPT